jgi:hypothetical protein
MTLIGTARFAWLSITVELRGIFVQGRSALF